MSRRAAHAEKKSKAMGHGQQAIWTEIRKLKTFTITDLWNVIDMHRKSIINYVIRLKNGGYVKQAPDFETSFKYELVRDAGVHAPRLTREGDPVKQGAGNANMWRSMRMLKSFNPQDVAIHSTTDDTKVSLLTAKAYCTALLKAEYLRVVQKAQPPQKQAVYRLIRDTGPKAPQIQRVKQVFDPNLGEVTYYPGARI